MSVIYQPTGMAREYSPYALNLYIGCSHHCKYCYAPHTLQRAEKNYFGKPSPRKDVLKYLEKDLQKMSIMSKFYSPSSAASTATIPTTARRHGRHLSNYRHTMSR